MGWYGPQSGDCGTGCCEGDEPDLCTISADNFNRPDSGDIGDQWNVISGTWSISSGALVGSGQVLTVAGRSSASVNYVVEADLPVGGMIVFDADGTGNYHYIHNDISQLRIGNQSGVLISYNFNTGFQARHVKACVIGPRVVVNYDDGGSVRAQVRTFTPHNGLLAGLQATTSVSFDNFFFGVHDSSQEGCSTCIGVCNSGCCTDDLPLEYVVDLGSPGLTSDDCNDCESIGGEYSLLNRANCQWGYSIEIECPGGCVDNCNPPPQFTITATLIGCSWTVRIRYGNLGAEDPDCSQAGCVETGATYLGTMANPSDCDALDITLSRDGSGTAVNACSGTWPATVTLRAA